MTFQHRVDKNKIPTCNILGVDIAAINMDWLVKFTVENIEHLSGDYMCVSNVHTTVTAHEDEKYRAVQNGGIMAIPDGGPLSSVGRKRGHVKMARTTGPDYLAKMLSISNEKGFSHYFYGSTEATLNKLKININKNYPNVKIAGMVSPPFRSLTKEEDLQITENINATNPDFVWIGLGAPKQEIWMSEHQGKIKGFMVGVGAAFDYFAGNISRAPKWMQRNNMEWLYRLFQEPRRLFFRYFFTDFKFIWNIIVIENVYRQKKTKSVNCSQ